MITIAVIDYLNYAQTKVLKTELQKASDAKYAKISDFNSHKSSHAPANAERNIVVGIKKNGTLISPDTSRNVNITITKSDVGLSNVNNTADSAKTVAKANALTTARTINGVSFNGTANIEVPNNVFANLTKDDLNNRKTFGEYYGGGGNGCTNLPSGVDPFYLRVFKCASGYTGQLLFSNGIFYLRYFNGSAWTAWGTLYSTTNKPTPAAIGAAAASHGTHLPSGGSNGQVLEKNSSGAATWTSHTKVYIQPGSTSGLPKDSIIF